MYVYVYVYVYTPTDSHTHSVDFVDFARSKAKERRRAAAAAALAERRQSELRVFSPLYPHGDGGDADDVNCDGIDDDMGLSIPIFVGSRRRCQKIAQILAKAIGGLGTVMVQVSTHINTYPSPSVSL